MTTPYFEPFQDRLSRDIRNELSAALPPALAQNDLAPVRAVAARYLQQGLAAPYVAYIEARLAGYTKGLEMIARTEAKGALARALVLWDLGLSRSTRFWSRPGMGRKARRKRFSRP